MLALLLLFGLLFVGACDSTGSDGPEWSVNRAVRGDTTILRHSAKPPTLKADTVLTLWRSPTLEDPRSMVRLGERLVIGDRTQLHIISVEGQFVRTVGRSGDGPGEFRSITSLGVRGDTIVSFDNRLRRLSYHKIDGTFLRTSRFEPAASYPSVRRGGAELRFFEDGLVYVGEEGVVNTVGPMQVALVWSATDGDSTRILQTWDDIEWKSLGRRGPLAHSELFPARALVAVGETGRYAYGDGLEYCVHIKQIELAEVTRLCRDWLRIPVTEKVRNPDLDGLERRFGISRQQREILERLVREQQVGDFRPSYDQLMFDDAGTLWVRTVGPEQQDVHPVVANWVPDLAPPFRAWDVYGARGQFLWTVRLPSAFEPRVVSDSLVFGFLKFSTGEVVIGKAELQAAA